MLVGGGVGSRRMDRASGREGGRRGLQSRDGESVTTELSSPLSGGWGLRGPGAGDQQGGD